MSYCRWSSDGFRSDVYAYENITGEFMVHVSAYRADMTNAPKSIEEDYENLTPDEIVNRHWEIMEYYDKQELTPINGKFDGDTIVCDDLESLWEQLKQLREHGYHIPDSAFNAIAEEMKDNE